MLPIVVINNYGQFNHLILRALRDLEIEAKMVSNSTAPEELLDMARGIILGGGPDIGKSGNSGKYLHLGLPVLGICLGLHVIALTNGGEVRKGEMGGYGSVSVEITQHNDLLLEYPPIISVWASHADEVRKMPEQGIRLAKSEICENEALVIQDKSIYGIQWHPEVSHTENGNLIFENFNRITIESL